MTDKELHPLPLPPELPSYTWRPARREDVPAIHAMLIAVDKADDRAAAGTLEDRQREFDDPWSNTETDSLLAFAADGTVAAALIPRSAIRNGEQHDRI